MPAEKRLQAPWCSWYGDPKSKVFAHRKQHEKLDGRNRPATTQLSNSPEIGQVVR
jgi:hypothetical protein